MRSSIFPTACLLGTLALVTHVAPSTAWAQDGPALAQARDAYYEGNFDEAINRFSTIAEDPARPKDARKEAFQYLGRAYVARRNYGEAREAVTELLTLEPPAVELDPDYEPPRLMEVYYDVRKELCGSYVADPSCGSAGPSVASLAVADFTNAAVYQHETYDPLRQGIASLLVGQLSGSTDLKVIERERLQWILNELDLQREAGIVDPATAVNVGKLLGATYVLFGTFYVQKSFLSRKMVLSARLVDVETGEILMAEQVSGNPKKVFGLAEDLTVKALRSINRLPGELSVSTSSLDAMISYSEGLNLLQQEDYRAALTKFEEALRYDPQYAKAQRRIDSLRPIVASSTP